MVAHSRTARVTAWPNGRIAPLEMWDVVVDGRSLFARRDEPTFYGSLAEAALAVRHGRAVREGGERLPAMPWESVAVVGGAVDEAALRAAFERDGVALDTVSADPCFAVATAVAALRARAGNGGSDAVVVDVGQTAIKAAGPRAKVHRARRRSRADERVALVDDVAAVLAETRGDVRPSFVLLAVPCEVAASAGRIQLGRSTYPTAGDGIALTTEILARAGCSGVSAAIVNDAVLAAWAISQASPNPSKPRLVLTIGHGVGAAFVAATAIAELGALP